MRRTASVAPEASEALERFLADIRDTPVLTKEQEIELAHAMREAREGLRAVLARIPYAVELLVRAWERRRDAGRVAGVLSEAHEADPAFSRRLDRRLARMAERRARREAAGTRAAERREIDAALARDFEAVDPRTDMLLGHLESVEHRAAREGERTTAPLGLGRRALDAALARARAHRDAYHEAKEAFVRHNLRLVVHMAKDYRHLDLSLADLVQEGNLGLIRAVEKFDERKGFRFSTYAAWWISQAFIRAAQRQSRTVRLPSHVHQRLLRLPRLEAEFDRTHRRAPTPEEIGEHLELGPEDVSNLLNARARPSSLDEIDDEDDRRPLSERI
ncbi:MAG: sigma-70 family RNA polymerase sigma factor, partial [Myxococcota bacterium]|nr:sigma-70 family RNA polymerase sigma factor [Myxococcota bacterium]